MDINFKEAKDIISNEVFIKMKDVDFLTADDRQISYNMTLSTIERIFNDEVKHCRESVDSNIATHLEAFKTEFISIFQHAYKDEDFKNIAS